LGRDGDGHELKRSTRTWDADTSTWGNWDSRLLSVRNV